jgi:hypothetical protein
MNIVGCFAMMKKFDCHVMEIEVDAIVYHQLLHCYSLSRREVSCKHKLSA